MTHRYGSATWDRAGIIGWSPSYNRLIHFTRRRRLLRRHKRVARTIDEVRPSDVRIENAPADLLDQAISKWLPIRTELDVLHKAKRAQPRDSHERAVARRALRLARVSGIPRLETHFYG